MCEVIDFEQEKAKREKHYACPICKEKGEHCPAWIMDYHPKYGNFDQLDIDQRLVWLRHTRHLRK